MNWLAKLKSEKAPGTHATKATKPAIEDAEGGFVGSVACPPAPFQKIEASDFLAANDAPAGRDGQATAKVEGGPTRHNHNPDTELPEQYARARVFLPEHAEAEAAPDDNPEAARLTKAEGDTFAARLAIFTDKGVNLEDAERLAEKLVIRDREGDDRRLCLECSYYGSSGRCVAAATGRLPGVSARLEPVPTLLQRCDAFGLRKGLV